MSLNQGDGDRLQSEASRSGGPESTFQLLERARAGDQEALECLFHDTSNRSRDGRAAGCRNGRASSPRRMILSRTPCPNIQENRRVRASPCRCAAGVPAQAVLNRIRNELRRKGRQPHATDLMASKSRASITARTGDRQEAVERYESALQRLKAEEREVIIARVEMGYSFEELAEALGKPSQMRRARRRTGRSSGCRGDATCRGVSGWSTISPTRSSTGLHRLGGRRV